MAVPGARIAQNTAYLTLASILQKIISFVYYGYLAKSIGEASLGKYAFALTFTSVFIIFMDFGLGPLLTREASKDSEHLQEHVDRIWGTKVFLIIATLIALIPSIHLADALFTKVDRTDVGLVYIGAIIIIFDTLNFTFFSIFRSLKQMHWEAIGIVIYQVLIVSCGAIAVYMKAPLQIIVSALLVGSVGQCVYLYIILRKKTGIRFRIRFHWKTAKKLILLAAPFAIAGILFRLSGSIDAIMLKIMSGDSHAGWYALAFKLTFALTVLPGAFATSYFPVVSQYFVHAKEKLHTAFETGTFYMLLLSAPITVGVLVLGDNIILSVWGTDWEASIMPLWILMGALPFVFLNYPVGNFLNAVDRQKLNTLNMCIALIVNIICNAILIPRYTFNGAALAVVISSVVLVALGIPWVYSIAPFNARYLLQKSFLVIASSGMMGFVLFFTQDHYHLLSLIGIGALVYFGALFCLQGITSTELSAVKQAVFKKRS